MKPFAFFINLRFAVCPLWKRLQRNLLVDRDGLIQIPRKDELIGYVEQDPRPVVFKQAQLQG